MKQPLEVKIKLHWQIVKKKKKRQNKKEEKKFCCEGWGLGCGGV